MAENFPLVTVVTPSYNQSAYLEATIRSVLEQDYPAIEYFVMDGGSDDGSIDIIRKYERRLAGWVSEKDKGQTDAINKGFARAKGKYLAWLNSDDLWLPGAVSAAVRALEADESLGMVYSDADIINGSGAVIGQFHAKQTNYTLVRAGYVHIPQQTAFFRKSLWDKVGPLDTSFYFAMDYDLWVRLAAISTLRYLPQKWAQFRLHEDAKTIAADERCWPEMLRVHYRLGGSRWAPIVWKYTIRKIAAPLIRWRRERMIKNSSKEN